MKNENTPRRILIADDQADVLEALRLLLKSEGYQIEAAASPRAVMAAIEARDFDVVLIDLNYTRDTTSGERGTRSAGTHPRHGQPAAGCGDDRLGQR